MKLAAARSLTAWLWAQHPSLVYALAARVPPAKGLGALGQCFSCDLDLFTGSCSGSLFSSGTCFGLSDPTSSLDPASLDPANLDLSSLGCSGLDSIGLDTGVCISTLSEADLTPVGTCALTAGCGINIGCGTSVGATNAGTGSALSGVAGFLTSGAGLTALANVASSYFKAQAAGSALAAAQAKAQAAVLNSQTARALAGQTALPVTYVANGAGTTTPMISTTGGLLPLTGSMLSSLTPASLEVFFAQYGTWILIGGAAAFLAYAATRRRRAT